MVPWANIVKNISNSKISHIPKFWAFGLSEHAFSASSNFKGKCSITLDEDPLTSKKIRFTLFFHRMPKK